MVQTSIGKIGGAFDRPRDWGARRGRQKAVTVFATVDEQARALAVSTGRTKQAITGFSESVPV